MVTPAGIITTVAGTGVPGFSGDGGPATNARLGAWGLTFDGAGNLYIADPWLNSVRVRPVGRDEIRGNLLSGWFSQRLRSL